MEALDSYVAAKKGPPSDSPEDDGGTLDAAVDELMSALKSGDKGAVKSALRAAVMECNLES